MPRRVALPQHLTASVSVNQARAAGIGNGRLRGRDLEVPFHGVRLRAGLPWADTPEGSIRQWARAYAPRLRPGQFFCDVTALALHGVALPHSAHAGVVHVGVLSPRRAPRTRAVVGHECATATVVDSGGLPALAPLEAWSQCAARLDSRDLVVIGDALMRRQSPLVTPIELAKHVETRRGCRGFRRLDEAASRVRERTDSPPATVLRLAIVDAGLPEPVVNAPIYDARGRFLGLGDLGYPEWRIVIEYDGGYHFAGARQIHHDIERLARFVGAGRVVIRADKYHLVDPRELMARIRAALIAAGSVDPSLTARKLGG